MRSGARRRIVVILLLSWPVAFLWVGWIALTGLTLLQHYRTGFVSCGGSLSVLNLPGLLSGCNGIFSAPVAWVELIVLLGVLVGVTAALARWMLSPVRAMAETVSRLGPTSLGMRLRATGPHDENRELADAIDAMLDRVAEGYEAQRRFASNASHELRTPLATQRALIEVSLASALGPEQLELLSRQLLATNERNERLVDGLLTLAETERGLISHQIQPLDRVARDVVDLHQAFAKEREVELTIDAEPTPVRGELPLLERLVVNLVHNAIKYNVEAGWVRVTVTPDGGLTVANSGPPVQPEQVDGLFEPFRRLAGERLDHGSGVGLGLTIARSIVNAHGGWIGAHAEPAGGLLVEVHLPGAR